MITSRCLIFVSLLCSSSFFIGCKKASLPQIGPSPAVRIDLSKDYGLAKDYSRHDDDVECTSHIIGYRFVTWLSNESVAVGFNTSPSCRLPSGQGFSGSARVLVFGAQGDIKARRDIPYDADGGQELVAPGEAREGPAGTLLFRIEEAGSSKSGVLLLDSDLMDVARIDRFMETPHILDHSLVFQKGFVINGPRTYDIFDGNPAVQVKSVTQDWPTGTMDSKIGIHGFAYMLCEQELRPNDFQRTNVVYSGAHRRCTMIRRNFDGTAWEIKLQLDQTGEIIDLLDDGRVVGMVRSSRQPDQLVIWSDHQPANTLPWFPADYDSELQSGTKNMTRYQGYGSRHESHFCEVTGMFCSRPQKELMIFDHTLQTPLFRRNFSESARAALSPDGLRYATFEEGELRIYPLQGSE